MRVLYTGVANPSTVQSDPLQSLGGFVSSNTIPNGGVNAIFPPISRNHLKKGLSDVRLIVLKNETETPVTSLKVYSERGTYSSYKLAAVLPAHNAKLNADEFEKIDDGHTLPYQAVLETCEGLGQAITISSLAAGASVGIWIERIVDTSAFSELDGKPSSTPLTSDQIIELLKQEEESVSFDQGSIKIEW